MNKFYEFGVSKKTVCKVYRKAGINPRYCNLYLKNTAVLRVKKVLENYLIGRNLRREIINFEVFLINLEVFKKNLGNEKFFT